MQVLNGLHSEKRAAGVDAMLLRLYSPILFRAFAAHNSAIRLNALQVLLAAFPLMVRASPVSHLSFKL
jgi:condensin-2 complex subunit G2